MTYEDSRDCNRVLASHQEDLADMITAEFTSDEMCFFMKYCPVKTSLTSVGGDTGMFSKYLSVIVAYFYDFINIVMFLKNCSCHVCIQLAKH